jgi:ribose transport system substrate-binding protein
MSTRTMRHRAAGVAAIAVAGIFALSACTSDTGDGGGSSEAPADGADTAAAQSLVDKYSAAPTWQGPTEPVDIASVEGKSIVFIAADFAIPFNAEIASEFEVAAKEIGLDPLVIDGKGAVNTYAAGIEQAISMKAGAIVLLSIGPEVVEAPLLQAEAAGIPVVSAANYTTGADLPQGITSNVSVDYEMIGGLQSAWAVVQNGGAVDAVSFLAPQFPADVSQSHGQEDQLKELCAACGFSRQEVQVTTFQQNLPAQVRTIVQSEPTVNWFFPTFDALNLFIVPGIEQGGGGDRVQTSSHNALEANLQQVLDGTPQSATIGESLPWWAYALVDQSARLIAGQDEQEQNVPIRIFTQEVLEEIGSIDSADLYGDVDFRAEYAELWGK